MFLDPDAEVLTLYASRLKNAIIVRPIITEAPLQKIQNVSTVTLEKILVDIFTDNELFNSHQGREMKAIF